MPCVVRPLPITFSSSFFSHSALPHSSCSRIPDLHLLPQVFHAYLQGIWIYSSLSFPYGTVSFYSSWDLNPVTASSDITSPQVSSSFIHFSYFYLPFLYNTSNSCDYRTVRVCFLPPFLSYLFLYFDNVYLPN